MNSVSAQTQRVWTMAGGGPGRTGAFGLRVRFGLKPIHRLATGGAVQAAPVFDPTGRVFVADMSGTVQGFERNGKLLWRREVEGSVSATPVVDPVFRRVFVGTHRGWLYCLSCLDGAIVWSTEIPSRTDPRIASDLLLERKTGLLIASSWGGQFIGFQPESGKAKLAWNAGISPQAGASSDSSGTVYFQRAVAGEGLICASVAPDGTERVLHKQPEGRRGAARAVVAAAPVIDEKRSMVYFAVNADAGCRLVAWSMGEQRNVWDVQLGRMVVGTPAVRSDGVVLVAVMDGVLYGIGNGGRPVFQYNSGAEYLLAGPVCEPQGEVYLADPLGRLHAISKSGKGRVIFEAPRSFQARLAFDPFGNLHAACTDHSIYVLPNLTGV
ncbi:MAG: PQQ-like beta-propeller repeat protein [Verrucomicrobia bacterium]|nr:PQQ-like beta-propeller repeat protein [Verrucomicrobiota bacterium]